MLRLISCIGINYGGRHVYRPYENAIIHLHNNRLICFAMRTYAQEAHHQLDHTLYQRLAGRHTPSS